MNAPAQRVKITKVYPWLIPFAIYLIALAVRLIGLKFSFPLLTHHDEQFVIEALPAIAHADVHDTDVGHHRAIGYDDRIAYRISATRIADSQFAAREIPKSAGSLDTQDVARTDALSGSSVADGHAF